MISAEVVLDSISPKNIRITTFQLRYPKFIHGEFMTHRVFSRNASSSRAVPVSKNLHEVLGPHLRVYPVRWPHEQKGMQGGQNLNHAEELEAIKIWKEAACSAAASADKMIKLGVHKSIVNRLLEPFLHINVVVTSTEFMNFFGLRLHKDAQPEIRALAGAMWEVWNKSTPQQLVPGQWHLPYIKPEEVHDLRSQHGYSHPDHLIIPTLDLEEVIATLQKVSVARCARVSYTSFETGKESTVEEDLKLFYRLVGAQPLHASPAEHQATPDDLIQLPCRKESEENLGSWEWEYVDGAWLHIGEHGNFTGWRQLRKMFPGESIAPLPEGYSL